MIRKGKKRWKISFYNANGNWLIRSFAPNNVRLIDDMPKPDVQKVLFFPDGGAAAFDSHGEQVAEAQRPWLLLFVDHLRSIGVDPSTVEFEFPSGRKGRYLEEHDNWETFL